VRCEHPHALGGPRFCGLTTVVASTLFIFIFIVIVIDVATPKHCTQCRYAKTGLLQPGVVIARSAPPKAVRDEAIGPLNTSRGSVFERSRLAFSETQWAAETDCNVATYGRSSQ